MLGLAGPVGGVHPGENVRFGPRGLLLGGGWGPGGQLWVGARRLLLGANVGFAPRELLLGEQQWDRKMDID